MPVTADNVGVKVLLLYKSGDTDTAEQISLICKAAVSDVTLYPYESPWRDNLSGLLLSHHVIIAVVYRDFFKYASAVFASGYAIGRKLPVVLFMKERYKLPEFLKAVPATSKLRLLTGLLREELDKSEYAAIRKEAEKILKKMGISFTVESFIQVVREGEIGAAEQFLRAGFSPDLRDNNGVPLICIATRNKHRAIVERLLQKGADKNAVSDDRGNTALMDAAAEKDIDILKDLIEAGADLNIKSKSGQNALILAVGQQAEDIASLLIKAGAAVDEKDNLGMSAKKYAELFKLSKVLELIEKVSAS